MAFSNTIIKIWDEWEIRALLLLSLSLQVILTTLGSVRKRSTSIWITFFVWSAYMSAEMVATVALGILARNFSGEGVSENSNQNSTQIQNWTQNSIQSLWTPFLILHLGGPDTITAYSLEDNELWPRHFLGIAYQYGLAIYVGLKSWRNNNLRWIAVPVFISGITKYVEKGFVLKRSSTKNLRNFMLSEPNAGPDYPEVMREKKMDTNSESSLPPSVPPQRYSGSPDDYLSQAYYLYNRLRYLYTDLILGYDERQDCHSMIGGKSYEEAFELVEGELSLLYDELYTKLMALHFQYRGYLRRCLTLFSPVVSLIVFMIFIDYASSPADILITYMLLIGAVALEVYGFVFLTFSDWTKLLVLCYVELKPVRIGKKWSRKISKFNLIKFCLRQQDEDTMWIRFQNLLCIKEMVAKNLNVEYEDVDAELKSLIFQQLKERSENINSLFDVSSCKKLLSYRGDCVLDKMGCLELLNWSTINVEFDHSLLLWHIATLLCYYDDVKRLKGSNSLENLNKYSKISKGLSDYMMYLLIMYPNMLPKGIGEIRYKDTCAEATGFFQRKSRKIGTKVDEACYELYEVDTDLLEELKGDATKSVLFYGSRLAKQLQSLESQVDWIFEKKWDMINKVWVELLTYAAVHCEWKEHGQQLRSGGELLTHVCLLMAHLGLSEQYQIQKEYFKIREDKRMEFPPAFDPFLKILFALGFTPRRAINELGLN